MRSWRSPTPGCCSARRASLALLPLADAALFVLTAWCALRWTSLEARGNALLWTLYAGFAWLPVAVLLQTVRDGSFALTGEWALGRAPIHALGMGFFGGMLVAMVTRVTMGHSGRPLRMDRVTLACFALLQAGALSRVLSEIVTAPVAVQWFLLGSLVLWLVAIGTWVWRVGGIYLAPAHRRKAGLMAEYYLFLRHAHIGFVIASVTLFTIRGSLMLAGSPHVHAAVLRYTSYAIDTMLLTAALMLTSVIHQYPFATGWLTMKVVPAGRLRRARQHRAQARQDAAYARHRFRRGARDSRLHLLGRAGAPSPGGLRLAGRRPSQSVVALTVATRHYRRQAHVLTSTAPAVAAN